MLQVSNIAVVDHRSGRPITLTGPLSFNVAAGEIFGLVGESGSGKTMCGLALIRLVPATAQVTGSAVLDGTDLVTASEREMRNIRGSNIGMIFQEPISALNPVFTLEAQLIASIRAHRKLTKREARGKAVELMRLVGIPDPDSRLKFYPHQLSGGLAQRAMIAMALSSGAKFLIADEPTTSLDVTIQEQIVQLIEHLARVRGISVLFISHDLGVVARLCKRVAVLYAGEIVEIGTTEQLLRDPRHPYTKGLLRCAPDFDEVGSVRRGMPGTPPTAGQFPAGCRFLERCAFSIDACATPQTLEEHSSGHSVRCCRSKALQWRAA